jgi:hypothetical protein
MNHRMDTILCILELLLFYPARSRTYEMAICWGHRTWKAAEADTAHGGWLVIIAETTVADLLALACRHLLFHREEHGQAGRREDGKAGDSANSLPSTQPTLVLQEGTRNCDVLRIKK